MFLFGPCIFTDVNIKRRPTTITLSYATLAHALSVSSYYFSMVNCTLFSSNIYYNFFSNLFWVGRLNSTLAILDCHRTKTYFCGSSVPTTKTTKRDWKPVQSKIHACQIEYKPMSGKISHNCYLLNARAVFFFF